MIDLIDSMEMESKSIKKLNEFMIKLREQLVDKKPIQALVFYFNDYSGRVSLSAFGSLNLNKIMDSELSHENRLNNEIVRELGPIRISNYDSIYEDALYFNEIDAYSLEDENDHLRELAILKAYNIFEEIFCKIDLKSVFSDIQMIFPFFSYIQEYDGGYSNLLSALKGNHNNV